MGSLNQIRLCQLFMIFIDIHYVNYRSINRKRGNKTIVKSLKLTTQSTVYRLSGVIVIYTVTNSKIHFNSQSFNIPSVTVQQQKCLAYLRSVIVKN